MSAKLVSYTKDALERASQNPELFCKELAKAIKILIASELEELAAWFVNFIKGKPELQNCKIEFMA